ncbi:MAG TPA: prepilin-type N-terminal cleavage/methylation domain-containing protein, partial [Gemmatimonadaceae bacterium]|nr:prepilin-type N-terminal cleavage/methylation domain-containing protein [Gemmatimonadaceae bacterium]
MKFLELSPSSTGNQISKSNHARKGFSMVEIIVAMVLLGVAVSALAGLSFSVSQSSMKVTGSAYRNGVVMQEVNRLETLLYDSLTVGVSTVSVSG